MAAALVAKKLCIPIVHVCHLSQDIRENLEFIDNAFQQGKIEKPLFYGDGRASEKIVIDLI